MRTTSVVVPWSLVAIAACGDPSTPPEDGAIGSQRPPITAKGASTLAGWADPGYLDGDRQVNLFRNPTNVILGPDNKVYVADFDNGKIRAVDQSGNATTVVSQPTFARPFGLAFIGSTLYVGTDNNCSGQHDPLDSTAQMSGAIWRVEIATQAATCLAGDIGRPRGLASLGDGRLAVSDYAHHMIRIFDPASATFTPLAGTFNAKGLADGNGAAAMFDTPYGMVFAAGRLVVADWGNHKLRTVNLDGSVSSIAGGGQGFADGAMANAKLNHPQGIAVAANGDLFITDIDNFRVRRIAADASTIQTIAGDGNGGYKDSEDAGEAQFFGLEGLSVSSDGKTVFVADGDRGGSEPYNRVRVIKL
jgi:DNA-binding beta-propeller fold protein YncE